MAEVERAFRESLNLYKQNPKFVLPHLVESILDLVVLLSMVITIFMAIGVAVEDISIEDPGLFVNQLIAAGAGLIFIIFLTFLFAIFLIYLIKAAAIAGVVGMAFHGFKGEKVSFGGAIESAKRHTVNIFIFSVLFGFLIIALFVAAFSPLILSALMDFSDTLSVGLTLLAVLVMATISIIIYVGVLFVPQFIVVANAGVFGSIKRSLVFIKQNTGSVLIYVAVALVFNVLVSSFFVIFSFVPDLFYGASELLGFTLEIFLFFFQLGIGLLIAPFFEIVKTRMIIEDPIK
jgi:hypothetical protein